MKRTCFFVILVAGFLGLMCGTSLAISLTPVTDLSGWSEYQWDTCYPITMTHSGSTVNFITDGTSDFSWAKSSWGMIFTIFPGSIGITAEVNVSAITGDGEIGIRKYVATTESGNRLSAEMYLKKNGDEYGDEYKIYYCLREKNPHGFEIKTLATGCLGGLQSEYSEWSLGEDVSLSVALVGDDVWFYSPGYNILVKIQIPTSFTPNDDQTIIYGYTQSGPGNRIEGTVKNINILYP